MYEKIKFNPETLKKYKNEICTFEISKLAKKNGIIKTNLSPICYDENGELNDGE